MPTSLLTIHLFYSSWRNVHNVHKPYTGNFIFQHNSNSFHTCQHFRHICSRLPLAWFDEIAKIETPLDLVAMLQYCWSNCWRYWQMLAEIAILIEYIKRGTKHYYVHSIGIFTFHLWSFQMSRIVSCTFWLRIYRKWRHIWKCWYLHEL